MKMKLVSVGSFALTLVLAALAPRSGPFLPFVLAGAFGVYGVAMSVRRRIDPLNDVPNALRVFLASLGGYFLTLKATFVLPSMGLALLFGAVYLNDEFQRRALFAIRTRRKGGSVALLGIDGSGKSSHSSVTGRWLEARGYPCSTMPFHRYLFVELLASLSPSARKKAASESKYASRRGGNPLRPVLSLLDNLILQLSTSAGCRVEGRVVIYDRFIWSTYIKYKALGYPVRLISKLYLAPRPTFAVVLDVPTSKSLEVIDERVTHIHYPREVLEAERREYLDVARRRGYPVIDATAPFEVVQAQIQAHLDRLFPPAFAGAIPR